MLKKQSEFIYINNKQVIYNWEMNIMRLFNKLAKEGMKNSASTKKVVCQCMVVENMINGESHGDYIANINRLNDLEKQEIIELYAGDSYIKDVALHCEKEDRYTISHYYRCKKCDKVFFIGFCCRGGYIFKVDDIDLNSIDFAHIMSGKEQLGSYFNNSER
jgi:hypothetical protein